MNKFPARFFALATAALVLAGCALSGQTVTLAPVLTNEALDVGRERPIYLSVVDARQSKILGYRKDETGEQALIKPAGDIVPVIFATVQEALADKGFLNAASAMASVAQLEVNIVEINYQATGTYMAPSVTTRAVFQAVAKRGPTTFKQTYRIEKQDRQALPLTADRNARIINETVSEALTLLADDYQLMNFLAGGAPPATTLQ